MTRKQLTKKIGTENVKNFLRLKKYCKNNGLKVVNRIKIGGACGDFTIFIYDKRVRRSYLTGFDGDFESDDFRVTYKGCLDAAKCWVFGYLRGVEFWKK